MSQAPAVRWTALDEERGVWQESSKPLKGSSPPCRRAPRLCTTAAEGPAGADGRPAEALHGRGPTSAQRRQRVGPDGLAWAREGRTAQHRPPLARATARRQPRGWPCGWGRRRQATAPGPGPGWPPPWEAWTVSRRAVTRRCVRGEHTRQAAADDGGRGEAAGASRRRRGRPGRRSRHLGASLTRRPSLGWAWPPRRSRGARRRGGQAPRRRSRAAVSPTPTRALGLPAFAWAPHRSRAGGKRLPAAAGPQPTGRAKALPVGPARGCWRGRDTRVGPSPHAPHEALAFEPSQRSGRARPSHASIAATPRHTAVGCLAPTAHGVAARARGGVSVAAVP